MLLLPLLPSSALLDHPGDPPSDPAPLPWPPKTSEGLHRRIRQSHQAGSQAVNNAPELRTTRARDRHAHDRPRPAASPAGRVGVALQAGAAARGRLGQGETSCEGRTPPCLEASHSDSSRIASGTTAEARPTQGEAQRIAQRRRRNLASILPPTTTHVHTYHIPDLLGHRTLPLPATRSLVRQHHRIIESSLVAY